MQGNLVAIGTSTESAGNRLMYSVFGDLTHVCCPDDFQSANGSCKHTVSGLTVDVDSFRRGSGEEIPQFMVFSCTPIDLDGVKSIITTI